MPKHPKNIDLIGVELEGGWDSPPPSDIGSDGSVSVPCQYSDGEIASPPLKLKELEAFIKSHHPHKVNGTCGFHIHISTKNATDYALLMTQEFFEYFYRRAEKWGKIHCKNNLLFWDRWRGNNSFCYRQFHPLKQYRERGKTGDRYTGLNYCHGLHGTLECRLFPAFSDVKTSINAVRFFARMASGYIERQRVKERKPVVIREEIETDDIENQEVV